MASPCPPSLADAHVFCVKKTTCFCVNSQLHQRCAALHGGKLCEIEGSLLTLNQLLLPPAKQKELNIYKTQIRNKVH